MRVASNRIDQRVDTASVKPWLTSSLALYLCLSAVPARSTDASEETFRYTSATSPDGVWIAENFGTNGCCSGGFVVIHRASEPRSPSDAIISSSSPDPGLFMIWQDDKVLSLVQESNASPLNGPQSYRGITIIYQFQSSINENHTFNVANVSKNNYSINEADVSAETREAITKTGRRCGLSISANDGVSYDKIGVHIEAGINSCNRVRECAGISSEFWVGRRIDGQRNAALTSATISDIPSYNRLPTGNHNNAVRGSFGESSANDLVAALSSKTFEIQYSLNFFDMINSYRIVTTPIAGSIQSFITCIGDGDFDWTIHERAKPSSPAHPEK